MDKKIAEELVEKYVDGSLPPELTREFEKCMAQEASIKEAADHAKLVLTALPKLRDDTPSEGYWRSYWVRLSDKISNPYAKLRFAWAQSFAFAAAIICIVILASAALSYRSQAIRLGAVSVKSGAELAKYFESPDNLKKDQRVFESLESTYPGQMAWLARDKGKVQIGLDESVEKVRQANRLLGIESVLIRTDKSGDISVISRPRIASLEGKSATIEFPAGIADSAVISTSLNIEDGKVRGPIGFAWKTQSGEASASSDDVSLVLNQPARVLSLTLDGAEYALLVRPTILAEN